MALLRATFQTEAHEHLHAIGAVLLDLEKLPPDDARGTALVEQVFREAHSLKGAARAVGLAEIEAVCQRLESIFAAWKKGAWLPSPARYDALHRTTDALARLLAEGAAGDATALAGELDALLRGDDATSPTPPDAAPPPMPAAGERPIGSESVRISTAKLDQMVLHAEEMLAVRQATGRRLAELRAARQFFDQWRRDWLRFQDGLRASAPAGRDTESWTSFFEQSHNALHLLDQKFSALLKAAEQDEHGTGKLVGDLLEESKKLLLQPISTLFATLPRAVRDLARDQGKQVELVLRGGEIELDKRIIEELRDPMLHLVRNAVDHGIGTPAEREHAGRPPAATINVAVEQADGHNVRITIADDGAGIDVAKVRAAAVQAGLVGADAAEALPEADALQLIFASDVSTAPMVTEISGRGLGLAIVREKAEKLGGRVAVQTERGAGTTFTLSVPLTLATFRGVRIRCGSQLYVVPTTGVAQVSRVAAKELRTTEHGQTVTLGGHTLPCRRLAAILAPETPPPAQPPAMLTLLVLGPEDGRAAFVVDEVTGEEEVLVKRLTPPLVRVRHIAAATVLASGRAVPILHTGDLLKSAARAEAAAVLPPAPAAKPAPARRRVLIAEDSITSRMLLKNIVESAGYEVRTAVDGQDALNILRGETFDLVMSDVDMPRMNGFTLAAKIRGDRALGHLPVVLITALGTPEDRARGLASGASAYIVKSSFDQSNLLDTLRRLVTP